MNIVKKGLEYFFYKIDNEIIKEALEILNIQEKSIFLNMSNYDKYHSLEVYKKVRKTELNKNKIYLKLALLHDCGKNKIGIIKRVLHKIGVKTELVNHSQKGYDKLVGIDNDLAILIKNHHNKGYSYEMSIFQKCDDES